MHILDAPWIGTAVGAAVLAAVFTLLWLGHILEKHGIPKNYSRGFGRGLLVVETMLRPSRQYVRRAKDERRKLNQRPGDPPSKC